MILVFVLVFLLAISLIILSRGTGKTGAGMDDVATTGVFPMLNAARVTVTP